MNKSMNLPAAVNWNRQRVERFLALAAIPVMVMAALVGLFRSNADLEQVLARALPEAVRFKPLGDQGFAGYSADESAAPVEFVKISEADGFGGPLKVAVAIDPKGAIRSIKIVEQRETPAYFQRVSSSGLISSLAGKDFGEDFRLGHDVDGVSGATYTARAIVSASRSGLRFIAAEELGKAVPQENKPRVIFGIPELVLILLISVWFVSDRKGFAMRKQARWVTLITSMVVLGFLYTRLLTLPFMTKMVMGFWPQWQSHLYWYTLLGFFLVMILFRGKNPYCQWICPFGAVQETLGVIGGAKPLSPKRFAQFFRWLPRGLAFCAVMAALLFRNPGLSSYEVFGTLFDLEGSPFQFALLAMVLVASLLIRRPWCRFLCPVDAVENFLRTLRTWVKERTKKGKVLFLDLGKTF